MEEQGGRLGKEKEHAGVHSPENIKSDSRETACNVRHMPSRCLTKLDNICVVKGF